MNFSVSIFQAVCAFMFLVFLIGGFMASWYFFRRVGKRESNLLFSFFLGVLALSLLHNLLVNIGIFNNQPQFYFIPIWYTLSFGPLLFFFVKSRLFRPFHLQKKDFKHFILPLLQATFYLSVGFRDASFKAQLWGGSYVPLYKPIEGLFYIVGFSFYLYFAYRFIRYKTALAKRQKAFDWEMDKIKRLRQMVKGLIVLFSISGAYIIVDFFIYRFFGLNLYNLRGFTYIGDLSFTGMVLWVSFYALKNTFWLKNTKVVDEEVAKNIGDNLVRLFEQQKMYMDDELDKRKLAYYLKVRNNQLKVFLPEKLENLANKYRIAEAKSRLLDSRFADYSLRSIGTEVGFPNKTTFLHIFEQLEGRKLKK